MYAIIESGGKQYRVQEGDVITVERLNVEAGDKVLFDKVMAFSDDNDLRVGTPYIDGASAEGEAVENGKGKKVIIFKYKAKKNYRKKQGHRQPYTTVKIQSLKIKDDKSKPQKEETEKKVSVAMKKDELIAYAKEHGFTIDKRATKAVIVEEIESALDQSLN